MTIDDDDSLLPEGNTVSLSIICGQFIGVKFGVN